MTVFSSMVSTCDNEVIDYRIKRSRRTLQRLDGVHRSLAAGLARSLLLFKY
ncbi:MAG TPA: hypothetical protein VMW06_01385 [Desulfobacterales bacterium]|nr:hypothetical protein [Desulfobacterales bacterium]